MKDTVRFVGGTRKTRLYGDNAAHELTQLVYSEDAAAQYTKTYGYDAAGRTTRVTKQGSGLTTVVHTYDWDAADRLTRAQVDTGGNVKTIEYAYNAAGLRVRRIDASSNVTKLYSCISGTGCFTLASAGLAAWDAAMARRARVVAPGQGSSSPDFSATSPMAATGGARCFRATPSARSSARARVAGEPDPLLSPSRPHPGPVPDWRKGLAAPEREGLAAPEEEEVTERIRLCTKTGRPCGDRAFVGMLERTLGRLLRPEKRGPKTRVPREEERQTDLLAEGDGEV